VLLTWRTGRANGKELFGVVPHVTIERGVWCGSDSGQADVRSCRWKFARRRDSQLSHALIRVLQLTSGFYFGSGQISKSQVLSELEFTLGPKEHALQANPYDNDSQNHLNVLQQVCCFL
jgi:pre-mRNA cleavage complex 2 protein Pcf11